MNRRRAHDLCAERVGALTRHAGSTRSRPANDTHAIHGRPRGRGAARRMRRRVPLGGLAGASDPPNLRAQVALGCCCRCSPARARLVAHVPARDERRARRVRPHAVVVAEVDPRRRAAQRRRDRGRPAVSRARNARVERRRQGLLPDPRGQRHTITGYPDLPLPQGRDAGDGALFVTRYYDVVYRGEQLRMAALRIPVHDVPTAQSRIVWVMVGETIEARQALAREIRGRCCRKDCSSCWRSASCGSASGAGCDR